MMFGKEILAFDSLFISLRRKKNNNVILTFKKKALYLSLFKIQTNNHFYFNHYVSTLFFFSFIYFYLASVRLFYIC